MAGSSPGTSGSTPSLSGETSGGAGEACPRPCNRGCDPLECTVKLPKSFEIEMTDDTVKEREYVLVTCREDGSWEDGSWEDGSWEEWELSVDNFVRTISTCHEVEEVVITYRKGFDESWKAVCESLKTVPTLVMRLSELSVSGAEVIFSVLGESSTVQKCGVDIRKTTEAAIVRVLVDALQHNQALQQLMLDVEGGAGAIWEVSRYMKALSNVLTEFTTLYCSDEEVVQLADVLGDLKQLRYLAIGRMNQGSGGGMVRIAEALRTNRVLETLYIFDTEMGGEEMEALVGALIPDPTSGLQPNTHLHALLINLGSVRNKEGMEQVATLLRSNTSLRILSLRHGYILHKGHKDLTTAAQMLFTALQSNASLESLDLGGCGGIGGKEVLVMIMDMLLHNHTLREILLDDTGLEKDGGAEVVYAELRARRAKERDRKLEEAVQKMEHVPPNSARVFLCGDPKAGKTTLCRRWIEDGKQSKWNHKAHSMASFFRGRRKKIDKNLERTRGIEVHKMTWGGMKISLWDMAGQVEYHAFHDLVLPNQSAKGECCFYFIVCNPMRHWNDIEGKLSPGLKDEIEYWLMFLASNTRQSKSYRPHVTILMTHHDLWPSKIAFELLLKKIVVGLKRRFEDALDLDQDVFIKMDNKTSYDAARMIRSCFEEYLKQLSSRLPNVLKACEELQSIVEKWCTKHTKSHILKWEDFSKDLYGKVKNLKAWEINDGELLDNIKKLVATSLHSGGHIMYFKDLDMVIMNPHWFCNAIIGNILFLCSELSAASNVEVQHGIISRQDLLECWKEMSQMESFEDNFEEILKIMTKLQVCYEDIDDKIMIPSLLDHKLDSMDWNVVFHDSNGVWKFLGTRLTKRDDTITLPSVGFFPRLQVYLHGKYHLNNTYQVYSNAISFIYEDINVIITCKDGSININARCIREGDHANHVLHRTIMNHINDLRQTPTLGCPGVILEEHIIWSRCVEHPSNEKFQSIAKKHLREEVLCYGDLKFAYKWVGEDGRAESCNAKDLLGDEKWQKILESREQMVIELDKEINGRLNDVSTSNNKMQSLNPLGSLEAKFVDEYLGGNELKHESSLGRLIQRSHQSIKRLIQCNHKEVMDRLNEMETKILYSQETLATWSFQTQLWCGKHSKSSFIREISLRYSR